MDTPPPAPAPREVPPLTSLASPQETTVVLPVSPSTQTTPSPARRSSPMAFIASLLACCVFGGGAVYLLLLAPSGPLTLGGGLVLLMVFFLLLRPLLRGASQGVLEELDADQTQDDPLDGEELDVVLDDEEDFPSLLPADSQNAPSFTAATAVAELDQRLTAASVSSLPSAPTPGELSPEQARLLIEEIKNVDQALTATTAPLGQPPLSQP